ncbi:MAG: hypothetical protein KDA96_26375, partial [Planctomycetaceae bacterium]|nr:hypothetical protein [Planctomycetaceae bacterium]
FPVFCEVLPSLTLRVSTSGVIQPAANALRLILTPVAYCCAAPYLRRAWWVLIGSFQVERRTHVWHPPFP